MVVVTTTAFVLSFVRSLVTKNLSTTLRRCVVVGFGFGFGFGFGVRTNDDDDVDRRRLRRFSY